MTGEAAESQDVTLTDAWAAMRLHNVSRLRSPWVHDLRQPLHTVSLNLELLSRSLDRDGTAAGEADKRRRYLDVVRRRLDDLQEGLQAYTDLLRPPRREGRGFDAGKLIREVAALVEPLGQRKGLEIELDDGGTRAELNGRREAVRDLLLAAALGGIESLAAGGVVRLRIGIGGGRGFMEVSRRGAASGEAGDPAAAADVAARPCRTGFRDLEALARDLVVPLGGTAEAGGEGGSGPLLRIELPLTEEDTPSSEVGES